MSFPYPKRVLRAALYDALKAAAEQFGGIGAGTFYTDYDPRRNTTPSVPHCLLGFLHFLGIVTLPEERAHDVFNLHDTEIGEAVKSLLGISWVDNDSAVQEINIALGTAPEFINMPFTPTPKWPRVPFGPWAEYFNLKRAVELPAKLYDQLKNEAEKNGGIGYGVGYGVGGSEPFPCCIGDYAAKFDGAPTLSSAVLTRTPTIVLLEKVLGYGFGTRNDNAVLAINKRKGSGRWYARVTFEELAEELNIIRVVQLPAPIYDKLKAAAEEHGGIGAGTFRRYDVDAPNCAAGLYADAIGSKDLWSAVDALSEHIGNVIALSDAAVRAINQRKGVTSWDRVSFDEWARELNVDRVVVLPAEVYNRLKESADKHGGIGADSFEVATYSAAEGGTTVPYCVAGHAALLDSDGTYPDGGMPTIKALTKAFNLDYYYQVFDVNDNAVFAINRRKGRDDDVRVSFGEWAQQLGVVRGDA